MKRIAHSLPLRDDNRHFLLVLLAVFTLHALVIAAMVAAQDITKPAAKPSASIQGTLVMIEPPKKPATNPPPLQPQPRVTPPPKVAPKPPVKRPNTPPPKATPSERSISLPPAEPETMPLPEHTAAAKAEPSPTPVIAPSADASDLHNPAPVYPRQSRRLGEQGRVLLSVLVLADGKLGGVRLKRSSGFKRLDDAALRCVKRWRFKPATRAGIPLDFTYELPIDFSLH